MNLSEDETTKKYAKDCGHCNRNTLLPYEYEWTCISCGFSLIKRKHEPTKTQRKKTNFVNRLNYAELKTFCICEDVYKIYEANDYDKLYGNLSTIKIKTLNINYILIEKYKNLPEIPDFEKYQWSRTAEVVKKIRQTKNRC